MQAPSGGPASAAATPAPSPSNASAQDFAGHTPMKQHYLQSQ